MKEHGILMSAPMVRAYLAGLKSQTRRTRGMDLINVIPDSWKFMGLKLREDGSLQALFERPIRTTLSETKWIKTPYGWRGDMLWFKETHALGAGESVVYRADYLDGGEGADSVVNMKTGDLTPLVWKPSIFMKRKYARVVTPVVNVRVERLHAITEDDVKAEGISIEEGSQINPIARYADLWNYLNEKVYPWSYNPWVWVYEFQPRDMSRNFPREPIWSLEKGAI